MKMYIECPNCHEMGVYYAGSLNCVGCSRSLAEVQPRMIQPGEQPTAQHTTSFSEVRERQVIVPDTCMYIRFIPCLNFHSKVSCHHIRSVPISSFAVRNCHVYEKVRHLVNGINLTYGDSDSFSRYMNYTRGVFAEISATSICAEIYAFDKIGVRE